MKSIINMRALGIIHSPFMKAEGTPIQPIYAEGVEGTIEIFSEFWEGLSDLDGFERVWLIYYLDRASAAKLKVVPFRDNVERGVFATRAPSRPNPIGLSVIKLISVEGLILRVADIDIFDGTPLLDIKPYIPGVDSFPNSRAGWFDANANDRTRADERFK